LLTANNAKPASTIAGVFLESQPGFSSNPVLPTFDITENGVLSKRLIDIEGVSYMQLGVLEAVDDLLQSVDNNTVATVEALALTNDILGQLATRIDQILAALTTANGYQSFLPEIDDKLSSTLKVSVVGFPTTDKVDVNIAEISTEESIGVYQTILHPTLDVVVIPVE
jgi:hypothetical protein